MNLEINLKRPYGVIKHNMSTENIADLIRLFIENDSIVLFSFYERNMNLFDVNTQNFISERCVFVNSEWVLPWKESIPHWNEPNQTPPKIMWFSVMQKKDIIKAIEIDHLFRCIVLKKDSDFKQHFNVLFHQEYYPSSDEDDYEYFLGFTNKNLFLANYLDKVKKRFEVSLIE
ncbi:hypothetical protein [Paenibacillus sp. M-152]|uniref:hypothetical protein n=1 Tax=Paenibacillus sp. M-152 TaxID=2487928 RepID=UPI000F6BF3D5|nr:hypothetical protein [Paenibacillus sp. M-152]AZH31962.1 hypothetical protein EGM68_08970 [Paenibacillus sp. M-152]